MADDASRLGKNAWIEEHARLPWIPAFAGMTENTNKNNYIVIPAKAGIQGHTPRPLVEG